MTVFDLSLLVIEYKVTRLNNILQCSPKENTSMPTDWLKIKFLQLNRNRKQARTVDVMMTQAKNVHFDNQSLQVVFLFFIIMMFPKRNGRHVLCVSLEY